MLRTRRFSPSRPPRVRHEPPTMPEAFAAARDLTADIELQVDIAAGLMGVSVEEARSHIPATGFRNTTGGGRESARPIRRTVIVERRRRIGPAKQAWTG